MKILTTIRIFILLFSIFLTVPQKVFAQTAVDLGTAKSYAVLGGSAISNTGSSVITGNMGLSPGSTVNGFPPGTVTGSTHFADAQALQAQDDTTTAYNALTSQSCTTSYGPGNQDIGGLTLTPGVYCFASSATITGTVTLNAEGDPDAVFIFLINSTLTTETGSSVSITGSGSLCNVFWQIGSSATLNTTTHFFGNILALTSITLQTDATVQGRTLARNGVVTLDTNTITNAACTASPTPTPTSTVTPTPTATASTAASNKTSNTTTNVADCNASAITTTPIIIGSKRISPTQIFLSWGPYEGIDTFTVRYGMSNGTWAYNTTVTGFSTTINDIPENLPVWAEVAATNHCAIGTYGPAMLIGSPNLPDAGFAPKPKR